MPQARDEAGNIWEVDAQGNPVRLISQAGGPAMPADPTFQYEAPKAEAALQGAQLGNQGQAIDNTVSQGTSQTTIQTNAAPSGTMWVDPNDPRKGVMPIPGYASPASATQVEAENKARGKQDKARVVRSIMGEVMDHYKADIQGQPVSRAFGATEFIDSLPRNERFSKTGQAMLALIRPMVAMGAKDGDSDKEMEVFQAYIPNADDTDLTIESKFRNLERLLSGVAEGKNPSEVNLSTEIPTPFTDTALGRNRKGEPAGALAVGPTGGDGERLRGFSPSGGPSMQQADETYSTPQDLAVAQRLQQVYNAGGSIEDMARTARDAGYPVDLQRMQEWARAIDYREASGEYEGQRTGFSTVTPPQSGQRSLVGQIYGDVARSDLGSSAVGFGVGAGNAASLGGLDEITGALNSLGGGNMGDEIAYANLAKQAAFDAAPGSALAGELLGSIGMGGAVGRAFPKAAQVLAGSGRRAAATGSGVGSLTGGLEFNDSRTAGAIAGGLLGAGGGVVGSKVAGPAAELIASSAPAQGISQSARKFVNTLRPDTVAPSALPQISQGQRVAYGAIGDADTLGGIRANLEQASEVGLPYSLADASPQMRSLAGSVSRRSQSAREMAEDTFDPRHRDQAFRARQAIEGNLAQPVDDPKVRGAELLASGSRVAEPFYTMANNRAAPVSDEIAAFLNTETGRGALREARRIAENQGRDPNAMGFDLDDQGEVVLRNLPSFETLDLIKQGIDAQVYSPANTNQLTGELNKLSPTVRSLEQFRRNYVGALDRLNPAYPQARAAYAPYAKAKEALELGMKGPGNRVKPRDIERITSGMTGEQLDEYRGGFATTLADTVDDTRLAGNPYDRIFGSTSQQEKIGQLFPEGADRFRQTYGLERDMAQTRYETLGGSPTAARMAADEQFGNRALEMGTDMAMDVAGGGGAFTTARLLPRMAQWGRDAARMGVGRQAEKRANELAPVLFNPNPKAAQSALKQIEDYMKARDTRKSTYRRRGALFGAGSPLVLLPSE